MKSLVLLGLICFTVAQFSCQSSTAANPPAPTNVAPPSSEKSFSAQAQPPKPAKIDHVMSLHGDNRNDPYFWMKNRDSKEVLSHLKAENQYYETMTASWKPLQNKVFKELKSRVKEDDSSPPVKNGDYYYYTRYEKGHEYPIYCRKFKSLTAKEQIVLNVNILAKGHKYTAVENVIPSNDHSQIAYGIDHYGRRFYDVYIKDLKTGKTNLHKIEKTDGGFVWSKDNKTLFFTSQNPETLRSDRVSQYDFSTGLKKEIYFEKDEGFSVGVAQSKNKKYIFIGTSSFDSSEYRYGLDEGSNTQFQIFFPRENKLEYSIENNGDDFYILTNWQAENFRVMKTTSKDSNHKDLWTEFIGHRQDVLLTDMLMLKDHLVLQGRKGGLTQIELFDIPSHKSQTLEFPDKNYNVELGANVEFNPTTIRYNYQSMVQPRSVYDYNLETKSAILVKQTEVPNYDKSLYVTDRVWATATDGTKIPVSILYKKGFKKDGHSPLLIYGYGSYGLSTDPDFSQSVFSLVDRGFVYAIAHIRGGSELGRSWYEQGRLNNKKNTFTDFIDATRFLISEGYADPKNVFAEGGSAGGLLMGAITNMRPDLYRGIIAEVPFVDVLTTMLDPDIPLTVPEYEQWGNPHEPGPYAYMKSYSPYDNLEKKAYPAVFVMTGYHDSQVQYWEPAKYAAKLRDVTTSKNPVILRIDMDSGHSGATGRFNVLKEVSLQFGFLLELAGITK